MTSPLLTVDEARTAVVRSAWRCLRDARCPSEELHPMLWGLDGGTGWTSTDRRLARDHRRVLDAVARSGHGWVVAGELQGIEDAALAGGGEPGALDVIGAVARAAGGQAGGVDAMAAPRRAGATGRGA